MVLFRGIAVVALPLVVLLAFLSLGLVWREECTYLRRGDPTEVRWYISAPAWPNKTEGCQHDWLGLHLLKQTPGDMFE